MATWTYIYSDTGGYDCMTGAYAVLCNGVEVFTVDLANFGQAPCTDAEPARRRTGGMVAAIVAALNDYGVDASPVGA